MSQPPSPLLAAVLASAKRALRAAIEAGDDINEWDNLGMTPLLCSVQEATSIPFAFSLTAEPIQQTATG